LGKTLKLQGKIAQILSCWDPF